MLGAGGAPAALSHFRGLFGYALIPALVLSLGDGRGDRRRTLLWLLCAAGAVTAARGVLSWAELNGLVHLGGVLHRFAAPDGDELVGAVPSLTGDFGYLRAWAGNFEGNSLGAFLVLLLPVSSYLAVRGSGAPVRIAAAAATALLFVALAVSYSRGAYLGLGAAALPLLAGLWRRNPAGALLLATAGVALAVYLAGHVPGLDDRLATLRALGEDPTVQHRQLVYREVIDAFRHNPLWGIGLGTSVGEIGTGADSLYLFLLLRGGLLVTAAFIALVWAAGRQVREALMAGRLTGLDVAVGAGVFGFAVHSAVDYTLWNPKVALTCWLMVGFLMAAARSAGPEAEAPEDGAL
jgi:O-antigen ligase